MRPARGGLAGAGREVGPAARRQEDGRPVGSVPLDVGNPGRDRVEGAVATAPLADAQIAGEEVELCAGGMVTGRTAVAARQLDDGREGIGVGVGREDAGALAAGPAGLG